MIDFMNIEENISDEMLAAYIDGNATPEESSMIQNALGNDELLTEAIDIVNDCVPFGNGDWGKSFDTIDMSDLGLSSIADFGNEPIASMEALSFEGDNLFGAAINMVDVAEDSSELVEDKQSSSDDTSTTDDTDSWQNTDDIDNIDTLTY